MAGAPRSRPAATRAMGFMCVQKKKKGPRLRTLQTTSHDSNSNRLDAFYGPLKEQDHDEDTSEDNCISVAHSDIVRLIRGGHNMGRHRRHKSKDQVKNGGRKNRDKTPPTHAYVNRSTTGPGKQKAAGKKLQLKFYRSCPSLRSSDMKFRLNSNCAPSKGYQTAIWEQIPNELEYCSSVPCSVSFRAA